MFKRRDFIKNSGIAVLGLTSSSQLEAFTNAFIKDTTSAMNTMIDEKKISMIGLYGQWAASLTDGKLPSHSFRRKEFTDITKWRKAARGKLLDRLGIPDIGGDSKPVIKNRLEYDGLIIEEMSWTLPYGRPCEGTLLKPRNAKGKLPGILALHDHGGNKYFGKQKITRLSADQHPMMVEHQKEYYSELAWANEIAKRGYVVFVPDAFTFESRRVWLADVPEVIRHGLDDIDHAKPEKIQSFNHWAGEHEHIMAKSLFCAGTSWPAVFFAEDQKALDILCAHENVDASRVGCCGLSGGGLRTVFMAGLDERIKCAVPVGFMTTWRDFLLYKSHTHTWMIYVPILPNELDFPEILGLCAPSPILVLNNSEDQLFTLAEMKQAEAILSEVYKKASASNNYKTSFHSGLHKFDATMQEEAFSWFDKWLK